MMVRLDDQLHGFVLVLQMLIKSRTFTAFILAVSCSSLQSLCCYITFVLCSFSASAQKLNARSNKKDRSDIYGTCAQIITLLTVFILGEMYSVQVGLSSVLSIETCYLPDTK